MHLWNPAPLADELRRDALTERDRYHYLLSGVVIRALIGSSAVFAAHATMGSLLAAVAALLLSTVGVRLCYSRNRTGDDRAFLERYMCLTVPILVQVYVGYVVAYYAVLFATRAIVGGDLASAARLISPYFLIASFGMLVAYYWLLRRFIGRIAHAPEQPG